MKKKRIIKRWLALPSKRDGFTLLELLISAVLLSIILGAIYTAFFASHKAVAGLDESMLELQEGRALLDIMRKEISASFYEPDDKNAVFKIEDRDMSGKQTSRIAFTGFSPLREGLSEIRYYVKETNGGLVLYKTMSSAFLSEVQPQEADLINNIEEFYIEAKNGDKWLRTWDSALMHKKPDEIKITIKLKIKQKVISLSSTIKPMIT